VIDPSDIDPETGRPYANYSSPSLDPPYDDDDGYPGPCIAPGDAHSWVVSDEDGHCYCETCGADGDA
jgi:hypothetical protein